MYKWVELACTDVKTPAHGCARSKSQRDEHEVRQHKRQVVIWSGIEGLAVALMEL